MNIEQAKQIPIEHYLQQLGCSPSREAGDQLWYLSPFRDEKTASFKINRRLNCWYDFGAGNGGDIIDLVMQLNRLDSVSDALTQIEEWGGNAPPRKLERRPTKDSDDTPALELTSVGPIKSRSLIAYLKKRGIDPQLAAPFVQEVHYRSGDKSYFALGLKNESGGFELRNPYFKGTLGAKDMTVLDSKPDRVVVFEGLFDFLSWVTISNGKPDATVIVLNSVAMRGKAAQYIRELNPSVVDLYRDRDEAGKKLLEYFQESLPDTEIIDWSARYPQHNDLSEFHAANCRARC